MYNYKSQQGSISFAKKLSKTKNIAKRKYLLAKIEAREGESFWNPGYCLVPGCGPSKDAFGNTTGL